MLNIDNNTHKNLSVNNFQSKQSLKSIAPLMAASWFIGLSILFWMYSCTDIGFFELLKYFIFFSVIFTLLPYKWLVKIIPVDYYFMIIFHFLSVGPILTGVFLLLNFSITSHPVTKTKAIKSVEYGQGFNVSSTVIELNPSQNPIPTRFRSFDSAKRIEILDADSFKFTIEKGLFGFDVLTSYHFIRNLT